MLETRRLFFCFLELEHSKSLGIYVPFQLLHLPAFAYRSVSQHLGAPLTSCSSIKTLSCSARLCCVSLACACQKGCANFSVALSVWKVWRLFWELTCGIFCAARAMIKCQHDVLFMLLTAISTVQTLLQLPYPPYTELSPLSSMRSEHLSALKVDSVQHFVLLYQINKGISIGMCPVYPCIDLTMPCFEIVGHRSAVPMMVPLLYSEVSRYPGDAEVAHQIVNVGIACFLPFFPKDTLCTQHYLWREENEHNNFPP